MFLGIAIFLTLLFLALLLGSTIYIVDKFYRNKIDELTKKNIKLERMLYLKIAIDDCDEYDVI